MIKNEQIFQKYLNLKFSITVSFKDQNFPIRYQITGNINPKANFLRMLMLCLIIKFLNILLIKKYWQLIKYLSCKKSLVL